MKPARPRHETGARCTALPAAEQRIAPHEDDWNRASHGNPATSDVTSTEIDAAEAACQTLETGP